MFDKWISSPSNQDNRMAQLHWKTFATAVLLTGTIVPIAPDAAQSQEIPDIREAEAGKGLMALTRAQQNYYLENSQFSKSLPPLGTNVSSATPNYYQHIIWNRSSVVHHAIARQSDLNSFVGRVAIVKQNNGNFTTASIICKNQRPGRYAAPRPTIGQFFRPVCAPGTIPWTLSSLETPEANGEARQQVGAMTRAQQAYFLENNRFYSSFDELMTDFPGDTIGYQYYVTVTNQTAIQYGISKRVALKGYVGAVTIGKTVDGDSTTLAIVCESIQAGTGNPTPPTISANGQSLVCGAGTTPIGN
jgi:Type IV pilin-like G and H, putative